MHVTNVTKYVLEVFNLTPLNEGHATATKRAPLPQSLKCTFLLNKMKHLNRRLCEENNTLKNTVTQKTCAVTRDVLFLFQTAR